MSEIKFLFQEYGFMGIIVKVFKKLKRKINSLRPSRRKSMKRALDENLKLDAKYGIDTTLPLDTCSFEINNENILQKGRYEAVPWIDFEEIFKPLCLEYNNMIFIDLGSGKGRSLFLATSLPFKKIIGVEFSEELDSIAKKNIKNIKMECLNIETLCLDATKYIFPNTGLVLFLYNPFYGEVMKQVVTNLKNSYENNPRPIVVFYFNPVEKSIWEAESFLHIYKSTDNYEIYVTNHYVILPKNSST